MSATIPESMRLDDLLKATGYDCPVDLQGKTFDQATGGGGDNTITLFYCKAKRAMIGLINIESEGTAVLPAQWDNLQYVDITPIEGNRVINNVSEIKYLKNSGYASYTKLDGGNAFYLWGANGVPYEYTIVPATSEYSRLSIEYGVGAGRKEIDVSSLTQESYTEQIKPSDGATAMSSLELVLTGIPTGGGVTKLYCWYDGTDSIYTTTPTPNAGDKVILSSDSSSVIESQQVYSVTEEGITIYDYEEASVYTRYPSYDIDLV